MTNQRPGQTDAPVPVIVPGWNGSGSGHWQAIWHAEHDNSRWVEQRDWTAPNRGEWVNRLDQAVADCPGHVIVVAHSLGCVTFAHWAGLARETLRRKVLGAFLVAPADVERECAPREIRGFGPIPKCGIPVPTMLIGTENDPFMSLAAARSLAAQWKSNFVNAGAAGHINVASGHGPWPAGRILFQGFSRALAVPAT